MGTREDFQTRIGRRSGPAGAVAEISLPAPGNLRASSGRAQVTLSWDPVDGAAGNLVQVANSPDSPFELLDHGGRDVLAVPHGPYVDTTGTPNGERWYAVAAVVDVDRVGRWSAPVAAPAPTMDGAGAVEVRVDAEHVGTALDRPWRPMIGSEHLSHMLSVDRTGGRPIGAELRAALRAAHDVLGVETVRAHGILSDDLGVYREVGGQPAYDFTEVDRVYDTVLELGLRPVVELSFMPRDLATIRPNGLRTLFGLRSVGDLRKPRWWALELLERLGQHRLDVTVSGDGGGSLVEALAARQDDDGRVGVLVWNGTLDQSKAGGDGALARRVTVRATGLGGADYVLRHYRVDAEHSNISSRWERIGGGAVWPDEAQWAQLAQADRLEELHPARSVDPGDELVVGFDLPMPGISYLEFTPQ